MTRRRGSTLLEVMMASAVLMVGLVGVIELLLKGAVNHRRGTQPVIATLTAQDALAEYTMFGYAALAPGTYDGGTFHDGAGRPYTRIITVDADAGVSYPAYLVTVRIESTLPGLGAPLVTTASTLLSARPDGG